MQTPAANLEVPGASQAHAARPPRPWYKHLSIQILLGMILGIIVGHVWPQRADSFKPLGDLFIRLVRMLVAPIIFCTVVHGIASVGEAKKVGRIAIKSLIYFEVVTTIALILALLLVNVWQPGANMHVDLKTIADSGVKAPARPITVGQFLLNLVPSSAVGAFADGEVIPVLVFSLLFAFGLLALGSKGKPVVDGIHSVAQVLFKMIGFVMYVAPIGAFGAIAFTVGKFGLSTLLSLGKLVSEFYVCCLLFVLIVLTPIAYAAGVNILRLIRYIAAELMIVVGTSSAETVFPSLIAKLRRLGVEESVVALVLPTGYSFNHDGTCLYWATVSVFSSSSRWNSFNSGAAVGVACHDVVYFQRRRRRCRFRDRRSRDHALRHERNTRRECRADSRSSQPVVVRVCPGERAGQLARDHCDWPHGGGRRFTYTAIAASTGSG